MRRQSMRINVYVDNLGGDVQDLLNLAHDLGYIGTDYTIEYGPGFEPSMAEIKIRPHKPQFLTEIMEHGLRGALRETDEVQNVLDNHPLPSVEQKIIDLFG